MNDFSDKQWASMSDNALAQTIGTYVQHHRLNQNRSQNEVAKLAGISRSTLSLLERGEKITLNTIIKVLRVLDLLSVFQTFEVNDTISPIEYSKLQKAKRKRARGQKNQSVEEESEEW